jgi:hypothetical protein
MIRGGGASLESLGYFQNSLRNNCDFWDNPSGNERKYESREEEVWDFLSENQKESLDFEDYKNQKPLNYDELQYSSHGTCRRYIIIDLDKDRNLVPKSLGIECLPFDLMKDIHNKFEIYNPIRVNKNAPTSNLGKDKYREYMKDINKRLESDKVNYRKTYEAMMDSIKHEYEYRISELERRYTSYRKLLAMMKIRPRMRKSLKSNLEKIKRKFISGPDSPASLRPNLDYDEEKMPTLHDNYPGGTEVRAAKKRFESRKTQRTK